MSDLSKELDRLEAWADKLEAHFKSHPAMWFTLIDLMPHGGPACTSRIRDELRTQRGLNIEWNGKNRESAYRYLPHEPLGRAADVPAPTTQPRTLFAL